MYDNKISDYTSSIGTGTGLSITGLAQPQQAQPREPQVAVELQRLEKLIEEHDILSANLQQKLQPVLLVRSAEAIPSSAPEAQRAPLAGSLSNCNDRLFRLLESYRAILNALEI
jgi:hypothetical protein